MSTSRTAAVHPVASADWRAISRAAWITVACVFGGFALWAFTARLDAAAVATGIVSVESNRKTIQHLEGGIVREILVHEGDVVDEGAVLIRLDDTQSRASSEMLRKQIAAALAEEARLVAERDQAPTIVFPPEVLRQSGDPLVARAVADQEAQFKDRRANLEGQREILSSRIAQFEQEVDGTEQERVSGEQQVATIRRELDGLRQLLAKNLVQLPRVLSLEREEARLQGTIGRSVANIAKARQSIDETRLQAEQLRQQFLEGVSKDLPNTRKAIADLEEKLRVALDVLRRVEIRAPQRGVVQGLKVFTVGGVIRPGDPLMEIVPVADELVVRAQVSPLDIDNVSEGSTAEIRFPAFTSRKPPLFFGKIRTLSRDRLTDDASKQAYYAAEVVVDHASIPAYFRDRIVAGMPADVLVATGERTAFDFLIGPLHERLRFGMREN